MRSGTTFKKRQKEIARMEKQRDKVARRLQRKADKAAGIISPSDDDDLLLASGEAGDTDDEEETGEISLPAGEVPQNGQSAAHK